jgi:hypothetical protein
MTFRMHMGASAGNRFRPGAAAWAERDVQASIALGSGIVIPTTKSRSEQLMQLLTDWLSERPLVRTYSHTTSGDPRLPSLVTLVEGGHVVTRNKGASECDAIAQALAVLAAEAS